MPETPQVAPSHYGRKYDAKDRWLAYWYQTDLVLKTRPRTVLEIGAGNRVVTATLKREGIAVTVVDIDPALEPDIVASVDSLPLPDSSVDTVLCAEVLEHIPFGRVPAALEELRRVAKNDVVISLPHWGVSLRLCFKLPFLREVDFFVKIPWPRRHEWNGEHHWEIGKTGYPPSRIRRAIVAAGFVVQSETVHPDDPAHRFYLLKKT